jgi:hypothetical protein
MSSFFPSVVWDVISTVSTFDAGCSPADLAHFKKKPSRARATDQTPGNSSLSRLPRYQQPSDASHSPPPLGMAFFLQVHWKDSVSSGSLEVVKLTLVSSAWKEQSVSVPLQTGLRDEQIEGQCVFCKLPARLEEELVPRGRRGQHLGL